MCPPGAARDGREGTLGTVTMSDVPRRRRFDRLLHSLRRRRRPAPELPPADRARVTADIEALLAERETNAQRADANRLVDLYAHLDVVGRAHFVELLAEEFGTDPDAVDRAAASLRTATPGSARVQAERDLRVAVTPRFARLLHAVTGLPQGVQFLVELRADLLEHPERTTTLGLLLDELTGHLSTLFDVGLLELRQITWDSPASVLERLIETEAVHVIKGWDDLRNRLDAVHRCYAFFHPAMANEPIVFVEVALTRGLADSLPRLLEPDEPSDGADTAIFYSITSAQPGLAGVHLGNELIKQVVDHLRRDDDELKTFATLSPLPGFREWLAAQIERSELTTAEAELLATDARRVVDPVRTGWLDDAAVSDRVRPAVLSAAARYLMETSDGRARDPVANFHLSNGASLERLNWLANPAPYGIDESLGVMVNYRYDRQKMASNARAYLADGEIRASNHVRGLIRSSK